MAKSVNQIIGLDTSKSKPKSKINRLSPKKITIKSREVNESSPSILNYVKSKITKEIKLGNFDKDLNYYGLGVDYKLSKSLLLTLDVTANIDPNVKNYVTAQQASVNFTYKK